MSHPILFFGTSAFAVPLLESLAQDSRFSILAVVTQPDRPVGRHAVLTAPPVKQTALRLNLPVLQFEKVKSDEAYEALSKFKAETAVVASFGQIIPKRLLEAYPKGMVNAHASILPELRGASPIAAAIAQGKNKTGVSIMQMDELMDHGPVLKIFEEDIRPEDTTLSLENRLAELAAESMPRVLAEYLDGKLLGEEQNHANATKVKLLSREDGRLEPAEQTAIEMERLVRAYTPWPGTYIEMNGKRLKILEAKLGSLEGYPTVIGSDGQVLSLTRVQPEGKQNMDGADYLRGNCRGPSIDSPVEQGNDKRESDQLTGLWFLPPK